ncbi:hypothetical protein Aru02nite_51020 [Actinocatenispora rupis]|uniref:Uncharacterized protein n=1 Tax=Actinocatenispora rupis TaxID=519421 RepID=A0A8J3J4W8_9ACTN|nr:hypothetical protein Aru02nite_51020 [Actinocatenispora rupis]
MRRGPAAKSPITAHTSAAPASMRISREMVAMVRIPPINGYDATRSSGVPETAQRSRFRHAGGHRIAPVRTRTVVPPGFPHSLARTARRRLVDPCGVDTPPA